MREPTSDEIDTICTSPVNRARATIVASRVFSKADYWRSEGYYGSEPWEVAMSNRDNWEGYEDLL